MTKKEQIEEMAKAIPKVIDHDNNECFIIGDSIHIAKTLYNAGYRKVDLDNEAAKEIALLKSELKKELDEHEAFVNNMKNVLEIEKKNAVKEFAEKLKERLCVFFDENENNDGGIDKALLLVDIIGVKEKDGSTISIGMIDDLLKEYENE